MKGNLFYGSATALVTPFHGSRIDFDGLESLIDWQIDSDTDALVVLGTTGEPPTISESERTALIECSISRCARRVPLIVGVGSNDTRKAIRYAIEAEHLGADALLVVTPYYNKTSRNGMIEHYLSIADQVSIPIIMYNVPSRTGVNLTPEVVAELSEHPLLRAVKEANPDPAQMLDMIRRCEDRVDIYTGNDDCVLQSMAMGAKGVISVAANIIPKEMHALTMSWIRGETDAACSLQLKWLPLIRCLFTETNPIPVKAALHLMGKCDNTLRLPLVPLSDVHYKALRRELKRMQLIRD